MVTALSSHVPALDRLAEELASAESSSKLPAIAGNADKIEQWLIALRMSELT